MTIALPQSYQDKIAALGSDLQSYCIATLTAANIGFEQNSSGFCSNNNALAQTIIDTQSMWMPTARAMKQQQLSDFFDAFCDFRSFVRAGTITNVTAANVGAFLASVANKERTLRLTTIPGASTPGAVSAIDVTAGWPANP